MAIGLLRSAATPRTTVQTPFTWDAAGSWKGEFMKVDESNIETLRELGRQRMAAQSAAKRATKTRQPESGNI